MLGVDIKPHYDVFNQQKLFCIIVPKNNSFKAQLYLFIAVFIIIRLGNFQ